MVFAFSMYIFYYNKVDTNYTVHMTWSYKGEYPIYLIKVVNTYSLFVIA